MSSVIEDDSINGSVVDKTASDTTNYRTKQPTTLRDRILEYVERTERPTKGSIFINVSSSGTAGSIVSALIQEGIFIEHKFDCGNCVYYAIDKTKIRIT